MRKLLTYIFIAIVLFSCSNSKEANNLFDKASSLMDEEHPDSAYSLLCNLAYMKASLSKGQQMQYELLKAESMNKSYIRMDTIKFMHDVLKYYMSHGTETEKIRANYMMGCICRDKGDTPQALKYYRDAVSLADTTSNDCDYRLLSRIYGQMASLFHEQRSPKMELNTGREACRFALKAKDTIAAINYYDRSAGAYHMLNDMDKALLISQKAATMYEDIGRPDLAAPTKFTPIDIYLRKGDYRKAKEALNYYKTKSGAFDMSGNLTISNPLYYYFEGLYYECVHNNDSALISYRKSLAEEASFAEKESAYKGMMSAFEALNKPDSVSKYARLFADANDSSNIIRSSLEINRMQSIYNYDESQRIAREKTKESNRYRATIIAIITIVILAFIALIVVYVEIRKKRKALQLYNNLRYTRALEQYHNLNKELVSIKENAEKYRSQKELEIEKFQKIIAVFQDDKQKPEKWNIEQAVLSSDIVNQLHQLASVGKIASSVEWDDLRQLVSSHLSYFYDRLQKKQNLTEKEFNVCLLIRLRFLPSEVSILLGLTSQRISNIRNGINQKLFNEKGAKTLDGNIRSMK
jgi:hypothetical protein